MTSYFFCNLKMADSDSVLFSPLQSAARITRVTDVTQIAQWIKMHHFQTSCGKMGWC